ncbi:MAG: hypothetical protein ACK4FB_08060 [Brevundimonas sp.]|uniref:hypothetical protein n=1 Tax=Brevundimonas sp. TaxID=1871086 RepID=UPI00391C8A97
MARRNRKPSTPRVVCHANDNASRVANDYNPEALTGDQLRRINKAERKLRSNDPAVRAAGTADLAKVEHERRQRVESARRAENISETLALEALRDPEASHTVSTATATRGRIHLGNRDGLESLWVSGRITDAQRQAGRSYRTSFEVANQSVKSGLNFITGGPGQAAPQDDRIARAKGEVVRLERMVVDSTDKANEQGRRLLCLREIAGAGHTLNRVAGEGSSHARHMLSFRAALDAIA